MNKVFLIGKVITQVEFKFIYQSQKTTKAQFKIELLNKSIISIIGYDDMADYLYRNLAIQDKVLIGGKLNTKMQVEVSYIKIF